MKRATAFVLPSRWKRFGKVLMEAMALGTPVVVTDCSSGPREIFEGERWGLVLAEAVIETFSRLPNRAAFQERALAFSLDVAAFST